MTADRTTLYRSALIAVVMQWTMRAIGLVSVVALARLLQPSDFGVVAVALSAAAFVELFGWIGLRQALVRIAEPERSHYDTAWTIQLALFLALALVMVAIAPLAAAFYGQPAVTGILCAMSLRLVALAVANIGIVDFERDMTFGRDMAMRLGARVASLVVTLIAAVTLRNYWALVIGMVSQSIFWAIGTFVAHPYRPRFDLSRRSEILGTSLWMFVSTFSEWMQTQIERLALGRVTSPTTVGLYSVSKDLSSIFTQEIATALNRVTFTSFARGDRGRGDGVGMLIGAYAAIVAPLGAGLIATAPDAITVLLGAKWLPAAPLLRIIAIYTSVQAVTLMIVSVLQASGHARRAATFNMGGATLFVVSVGTAAALFRQPDIVAVAALCASATVLAIGIALLAAATGVRASALIFNLVRPLAASIAMAWAVEALRIGIDTGFALVDLMVQVCAGLCIYPAALLSIWLVCGRPPGAEQEAVGVVKRLAAP